MSCRLLSRLGLLVLSFITSVDAHGMVTSPRSRQWVAYEDGIEGSQANKPPREYCYQCANRNSGVCGNTPSYNYDDWLDSTGHPMPWQSQATVSILNTFVRMATHPTHPSIHLICSSPLSSHSMPRMALLPSR